MTAIPTDDRWKVELAERLIVGAAYAAIQAPEDEHAAHVELLDDLKSFADLHGGMTDGVYLGALLGLARVAYRQVPDGAFGALNADVPLELVAEDIITGRRVADPDADLADGADDVEASCSRGTLAAMRFFTAVANDDMATATAVFLATDGDTAGVVFLDTLLRYCGGIVADWLHRDGKFSPDADAMWVARRAADEAAAPEPREVRHDPRTGLDYVSLPVDARDQHPDDRAVIAPHGGAVYAMTMYRLGTPGHREQVVVAAVAAAGGMVDPGTTLCGVHHAEDIEVQQMPHTARRLARRALRDATRDHGGTWQIVRTWQHYGRCPAKTRTPGPDDVPLFDMPGGAA